MDTFFPHSSTVHSQRQASEKYTTNDIDSCYLTAATGMPNSGGLKSRRKVLASVDAPPVALLKRAGAIPLGVTNTSELCMWMESSNHLYGITSNPYDLERMCGGSSGLANKNKLEK